MNTKDILRLSMHGLHIYSHILSKYYPDSIVLEQVGNQCKPARNPFNQDKQTLLISLKDDIFCYQDTELDQFKGTAFDFAAYFYQLSGDELLEKINQELNLHLGGKKTSFDSRVSKVSPMIPEKEMPRCSFFYAPISNTKPYAAVTPLDIYKKIKGTAYAPRTQRLRSIVEPVTAAKFKQNSFDYVTFAGEFSNRSDKALVNPSGLMVFDFDKVKDLPRLKQTLIQDEQFETILLFVSPSGIGLKWIISVDLTELKHEGWFTAVANYLDASVQEKVDRSGKDVSRACFLCHDPEVWINPIYLI